MRCGVKGLGAGMGLGFTQDVGRRVWDVERRARDVWIGGLRL